MYPFDVHRIVCFPIDWGFRLSLSGGAWQCVCSRQLATCFFGLTYYTSSFLLYSPINPPLNHIPNHSSNLPTMTPPITTISLSLPCACLHQCKSLVLPVSPHNGFDFKLCKHWIHNDCIIEWIENNIWKHTPRFPRPDYLPCGCKTPDLELVGALKLLGFFLKRFLGEQLDARLSRNPRLRKWLRESVGGG